MRRDLSPNYIVRTGDETVETDETIFLAHRSLQGTNRLETHQDAFITTYSSPGWVGKMNVPSSSRTVTA